MQSSLHCRGGTIQTIAIATRAKNGTGAKSSESLGEMREGGLTVTPSVPVQLKELGL
jgi:hypothetical protein